VLAGDMITFGTSFLPWIGLWAGPVRGLVFRQAPSSSHGE